MWIEEQEQSILRNGSPLTYDQQIDAYLAGIKEPNEIRVQYVKQMPFPENAEVLQILNETGIITQNTIGLCLRKGIYIHTHHKNNRRVLVHELAHTMQYERYGSVRHFLEQYIHEHISFAYPFGPLEQEATALEHKICQIK